MSLEIKTTNRGFKYITFKDDYNKECKLLKSSSINDSIWLGVCEPLLTLFIPNQPFEKYNEKELKQFFPKAKDVYLDNSMHLTRDQVAELLPYLEKFVKEGEI